MKKYTKVYTRENTLFSIQVWEEHQGHRLKNHFGENAPISLFEVRGGVAYVHYVEDIFEQWQRIIAATGNSNPEVIEQLMDRYATQIEKLEEIWRKEVFASREELVAFFDFMADMWVGVSVSYCLPETKNIDPRYQDLGMQLRNRSVDFLDNTDRVVHTTLQKLYPELGDLVKYISIEELRAGEVPDKSVLEDRQKQYLYFDFKILTGDIDVKDFALTQGITLVEEKIPEGIQELKGQVAMKGKATGRVRVLQNKSQIKDLVEGEVLVTAMTTPDFLPAMNKAVAFVTDEGGITCHAAIVAREMKKPCVIGTKFATQVLKNGDEVEVDADAGIVKLIT